MDPIVREGLELLKRLGTRVVARGAEEVADTAEALLNEGRRRVGVVKSNARRIRERSYDPVSRIDDADEPYGFRR